MQITGPMSETLARYVDLAADETKLTAQNMANIDTPGYRAVGIDFEGEMRAALSDAAGGAAPHSVTVRAEDGLVSRPDGNNVSMDRESLNLAEAQLKYRTGVALLHLQYQMTLDAIRADSGK